MAKEKTKEKAEEKEAAPEFKYGVPDLAEALDLEPASVRVKLRAKGIDKAGKSYGWNTKAELQEVIDAIKAKPAKSKKEDPDEEEEEEEEAEEEEEEAPKAKSKKRAKA